MATRASDRDLAHHVPLMEGIGKSRGADPADVEAVVTAYRGGAIKADYGHKLILGLPHAPLPRAIAAFKSGTPLPEQSRSPGGTMGKRELTDHQLRVHGNLHGCPEAGYFSVMADLYAGRVTEAQALDNLKLAGEAATRDELSRPAPAAPSTAERRTDEAAADILVKAYLKGDPEAVAAVRAANPEPEPENSEISAEQLDAHFARSRTGREIRR